MEPVSKKISASDCASLGSFLQKHGFSSSCFTKKVSYTLKHTNGQVSSDKNTSFRWPRLTGASEEKVNEVTKEVSELKKTLPLLEKFEVRLGIDAGDKYETIAEVEKVFGDEEKVSVEHKDGQVLLIDFWATW